MRGIVAKSNFPIFYHRILRGIIIKTYCKNVDICNPQIIEPWISLYRSTLKPQRRASFNRLSEKYGDIHGISIEIAKRIQCRNLNLPKIKVSERCDKSSNKIRKIGVESTMQQIMDYIAVYTLMPMLRAKIGYYQCASIPKRGQIFGKKAIEKWIRNKHQPSRYFDKMDIRHCFESISSKTIEKLLNRDIRKNPTLIWFVVELCKTHGEGLSIGSFLSQWLCNYVMSYAYHYASEKVCKTRRNKKKMLFDHVLFYMDDIYISSRDKRDLRVGSKMLVKYFKEELGLTVKPNHIIHKIDENNPIDMMGYVITPKKTIIRARIFKRLRRICVRGWRLYCNHQWLPLSYANKIIAYNGIIKYSDSRAIRNKLHFGVLFRQSLYVRYYYYVIKS